MLETFSSKLKQKREAKILEKQLEAAAAYGDPYLQSKNDAKKLRNTESKRKSRALKRKSGSDRAGGSAQSSKISNSTPVVQKSSQSRLQDSSAASHEALNISGAQQD